ncbi:hypothetical protein HY639_04320 [Candidatus Woesearchaeota archaeon]|nr:hypothetical protein [Candidatus Woesearchaeota archaeon]
MDNVIEGLAVCAVPKVDKITARMLVFYNPQMKENRDITILFLNNFFTQSFQAASLMAGTGLREVRFLKEVPLLSFLAANDGNPRAVILMQQNIAVNGINAERYVLSNDEASSFLLSGKAWDYIDIDPFGSPNPFLDAAIKKCRNHGVLGITATDTAALTGTYPQASLRKYWASPLRHHLMHEVGIRILLRKIQLIAAQYDKAAVPKFCYASQHYYRAFVELVHRKSSVDEIMQQHQSLYYCPRCQSLKQDNACCGAVQKAGPMWTGALWDARLAQQMATGNVFPDCASLLKTIEQESLIPVSGFFSVHFFAKHRLARLPPSIDVLRALHERGFAASRTHFSPYGIRTNAPTAVLEEVIQSCAAHQ